MKDWQAHGYEQILTEDGSPSLKSASSPEAEAMHHCGGAMTESRAIYGRLIQATFRAAREPRFLSLGLGLGYNEILIAEEGVRAGSVGWSCVSYEADPFLTNSLLGFLADEPAHEALTQVYSRIFDKIDEPDRVRKSLLQAHHEKRWLIEPAMTKDMRSPFRIHAFLWDAFSQKTSPELWEESFLENFLKNSSDAESSALTTYACIGKLKRALRASDFRVEVCPGFSGKKNSTLAWRGPGWEEFEKQFSLKTAEHPETF